MARDYRTLGWDYVSFVLFIAFSTLAPLWSRIYGKKKQRTKADYVFATGGVSLFAIMLSIGRTTIGIRSILGYPSELIYRGSGMWETIYGIVSAYPIVCFIFVPVYFNLGITSVYQYLDLRFKSRLVRCLASGTYICRQICTLGITIYTPSVALSAVIGIPYWASIVGISIICIFFTVLGGLKAAINADVIQTMSVILVTAAVIAKGTFQSGGISNVYNYNKDQGRLKFFNFTGDMTVRVDTTSAWLGQLFMSLSQFGCQQNFMQRYVSLRSLKEVKRAMMFNIPIIIVFFSFAWTAGMAIFATYINCDPYAAGYIGKTDEILPFFVEDQMGFLPGFLGLFMATLFNGALCLNVSNLNSLATVLWEDFLSQMPQFKGLSDKQQLGIIKVVTVIFGFVVMGIAFCVGLLTGVIESSMLAFSATSGPLLAAFLLAMLCPIANWKGTAIGMIVSHVTILWITFGGLLSTKESHPLLETNTDGCSNHTFASSISKPEHSPWLLKHVPVEASWAINSTTLDGHAHSTPERSPIDTLYAISFMYYSLIGTVIAVVVGVIVSYFTQSKEDSYDAKLLHPMIYRLYERFPGPKPYYVKEIPGPSTTTTTENGSKSKVENGEKVNHAFEPNVDDQTVTSKTATGLNGVHLTFEPSSRMSSKAPHPDIAECTHWSDQSGTYKQKSLNDLV